MSDALPILPALLFSVVVHELAHGWVALRLGDPTARDAGGDRGQAIVGGTRNHQRDVFVGLQVEFFKQDK